MRVLAIDTSSAAVLAAVAEVDAADLRVLARRRTVNPRGHTELLAGSVAECLAEAGMSATDLAAVVAGLGPGPYTGLRVGLVTAAAMAHALELPSYGVCSLDAIAGSAQHEGELLVVTDARRREVYWGRYDAAGQRVDGPHVNRPADVPVGAAQDLAGAGARLYRAEFAGRLLDVDYPDPAALVAAAADRIRVGAPAEPLVPLYLRRPDAVPGGAPKPVRQ